jgi:hypothetical protein
VTISCVKHKTKRQTTFFALLAQIRRKHLPVSKSHGNAPFVFTILCTSPTSGSHVLVSSPFMSCSKQTQTMEKRTARNDITCPINKRVRSLVTKTKAKAEPEPHAPAPAPVICVPLPLSSPLLLVQTEHACNANAMDLVYADLDVLE